jgi:hypothetical protein
MTVSGFNTVSSNITLSNTPTNTTNNFESLQIGGIGADTLKLGIESLGTGISISKQIMTSNKAIRNPDGTVAKTVHGNASILRTGRNAAIFGGLVSLTKNTYDYLQGNFSGTRLGGNVASDVIGALGSGMIAAGTGSLAAMSVGSSLGGGVIGFLVGATAFAGADYLYRKSGIYQRISDNVTEFLDNLFNKIKPPGGW